MKELIFVRHAKSDWNNPLLTDIQRPLGPRGLRDAPVMARKLHALIPSVDHLVSSNAVRALETAAYFARAYDIRVHEIESVGSLYHAYADDILREVYRLDPAYSRVMFFGHNPGYTYLANEFSKEVIDNVPTCGIFKLDSSAGSWKEVSPLNTKLTIFLKPRNEE